MNAPRHTADFFPTAGQYAAAGLLGYVHSSTHDNNALLSDIAWDLIGRRLDVHGAVQVNTDLGGTRRCDMDLELLPSGQRLRVSQGLGAGARGCRLDSGALETAVGTVTSGFRAQADLLVINKFGKTEVNGSGFRALIAEAVSLGVPVLTSVNTLNLKAFHLFSAGYHVALEPDHEAITDWFLQKRSKRSGD